MEEELTILWSSTLRRLKLDTKRRAPCVGQKFMLLSRGEPSWNGVCNQNGQFSNSVNSRIERSQQSNESYNLLGPRMGTSSQGKSISYHPQYSSTHLNEGVHLQREPDRVV
ncbi:unnamed protein product [Caenorhabditis brenneri]